MAHAHDVVSEYPQSRTIAETVLWYTVKESQNAAQNSKCADETGCSALMNPLPYYLSCLWPNDLLIHLILALRFYQILVTGLLCLLSHSSSEIANKAFGFDDFWPFVMLFYHLIGLIFNNRLQ